MTPGNRYTYVASIDNGLTYSKRRCNIFSLPMGWGALQVIIGKH